MAIYGALLEDYLLEKSGLNKDDAKDPDKIKKKVKEIENNKKISLDNKVVKLLAILGFIILAIPIGILAGLVMAITMPIRNIISKLDNSNKNKSIDKTIKSYKKNIEKLNNKLKNTTDSKEKSEIKKVISSLEKEITELEKQKTGDNLKYEIKEINNAINAISKNDDIGDRYWELSLGLTMYDMNQSEFEKWLGKVNQTISDAEGNGFDSESMPLFSNYLKKYPNNKCDYWSYGDNGWIYDIDNHKFICAFNDWTEESIISYNQFKDLWKKNLSAEDLDKYKQADQYLGYYRLSKAPSNAEIKPLPKY